MLSTDTNLINLVALQMASDLEVGLLKAQLGEEDIQGQGTGVEVL